MALALALSRETNADIPDLGVQEEHPIALPNVSSSVLSKILEWCEHHKNDPLPTSEANDTDDSRRKTSEIGEWDQK